MAIPKIKTILYATSLGKHTRPVFRQAVNQALLNDARIVMLHVVEPMGEMGHALMQHYVSEDLIKQMHDEGIQEIHNTMHARIEKFCDEELQSLDNPVELNMQYRVAEGNHVDSILGAANEVGADMIILGAENRFGHHSHTSQHVTKHAKIPVLVVPTGKNYI